MDLTCSSCGAGAVTVVAPGLLTYLVRGGELQLVDAWPEADSPIMAATCHECGQAVDDHALEALRIGASGGDCRTPVAP